MKLIRHLASAIYGAFRPLPRIERIKLNRQHLYQRQQINDFRGIYDVALDNKVEQHTKILARFYRQTDEDDALLSAALKEVDAEFPLIAELTTEEK